MTAAATNRPASACSRPCSTKRGPYLSTDPNHQGLLLHSVYHWPNAWDYVPPGVTTPRGESSQWGDYHAREAALYVKRIADGAPYHAFFGAGATAAQPAGATAAADRR